MSTFLFIALSHFLALLSPGPDFLLLSSTSLRYGKHLAFGTVLGISSANGIYIALALSGTDLLQQHRHALLLLQLSGSVYLFHIGLLFWRHSNHSLLLPSNVPPGPTTRWYTCFKQGLFSALLNPKNVLFYFSLASLLPITQNDQLLRWALGIWMFCIVLGWNNLLIGLLTRPVWQQKLQNALPYIERVCSLMLMLLAFYAGYNAVTQMA